MNPSTDNPLISVIVPVYNAEKYLERCLRSILGQTYSNIELLLIDDGSRDGSGAICDEHALRDARIKVIHKNNAGVSAARNDGIEAAKGEYIAFCDNDDFYASGMLERLLGMCVDNACGMAQCRCERGWEESLEMPSPQAVKVMTGREMLEDFYVEASCYIWDKLYRREVWEGVRFPVGSYTGEDAWVVHHLLLAAGRIAVTREKLYYHYRNPDSVTESGFDVRWADGALEERLDFARREGLARLEALTMAQCFYKEAHLLVMNRRYNSDDASRREFRRRHRTLFRKYYREAMRTPGVPAKDLIMMSVRRFLPLLYHLYNHLKWRVVRRNKAARFAEIM